MHAYLCYSGPALAISGTYSAFVLWCLSIQRTKTVNGGNNMFEVEIKIARLTHRTRTLVYRAEHASQAIQFAMDAGHNPIGVLKLQ